MVVENKQETELSENDARRYYVAIQRTSRMIRDDFVQDLATARSVWYGVELKGTPGRPHREGFAPPKGKRQ